MPFTLLEKSQPAEYAKAMRNKLTKDNVSGNPAKLNFSVKVYLYEFCV